jgi:isopenicillin N synthase-like dioxygenase
VLFNSGSCETDVPPDYGTITLLFQDSVGGLEVQNPHTKVFQPARPIVCFDPCCSYSTNAIFFQPGTIVVNVADLLARWSNDVLRSTLHRVVAPPSKKINDHEEITPARQSIAFFCNPNFDAEISCLPNCSGPGMEKKYPSVTTEEYIVGRLAATYN